MSLRDIKPTLRKYERKLQTKKGEDNNQKIKKLSKKRCKPMIYFEIEKIQLEVAIDLELDYEQVFYQRFTNN